jgi:Ca2+-binding EF-hand superfamily protein
MKEMQAFMKRLDINRDGHITEDELLKVMKTSSDAVPQNMLP